MIISFRILSIHSSQSCSLTNPFLSFQSSKLRSETHINQTKIVFIDWKLFRTNLFLQSWGIGALEKNQKQQNISVATVKVAEEKKKKAFQQG